MNRCGRAKNMGICHPAEDGGALKIAKPVSVA